MPAVEAAVATVQSERTLPENPMLQPPGTALDTKSAKTDPIVSLPSIASRPDAALLASSGEAMPSGPAIGASIPQSAPGAARIDAQPAPATPLETLIDNLAQARESGRSVRGDITVRHMEFGAIALRLDQNDGDLTARLFSRDPGFAPAAQAALAIQAERAALVSATLESATAQHRGQDNGAHNSGNGGTQRDPGTAQHGQREQEARGGPDPQSNIRNSAPTSAPAHDRAAERGLLA